MINRIRRQLIRFLVGRMEVCLNMAVNGEVEYSGGAICENNRFVTRESST